MPWAPTQRPVANCVWQLPSICRKTNLKKCPGSLGDVCQPPREVRLGGAGSAEITTVRDKLHQETLPWSFTLWHCIWLWWMSYLKNMAWPQADLEALTVSSKFVFEDSEAKVNIRPCVVPAACWEDGWRAEERLKKEQHYPFVCMGLERRGKGGGKKRTPEWK